MPSLGQWGADEARARHRVRPPRVRIYWNGPLGTASTPIRIGAAGRVNGPVGFSDAPVLEDPVIVFEVLRPNPSTTGHIEKNQEYRDTQSIQRYVILEQTREAATVFSRAGDDRIGHILVGGIVLTLPEIGAALPLRDLYEGVVVPAREGSTAAG